MLFSEIYKIMVNKVAFVGLGGAIAPSPPSGSAPAGRAEATIKHMASVSRYVTDNFPWINNPGYFLHAYALLMQSS